MQTDLCKLTTIITAIAATISIAIALHPEPTEAQTDLGTMTNTITSAGAIALFGLLDDEEHSDQDGEEE